MKMQGATCNCPNGGGSEGRISLEVENHEIGYRFRLKLNKILFEDIHIVDSSSKISGSNSPTSARREL